MAAEPNVLFVFTDQHRAAAMGCSGNPDIQTPNLDRFAADGTRFSNAYANDPVCTPSRGCILTGQYPFRHGAACNELRLNENAPTIAKELSALGYRTGYVGKWHLDGLPRDRWTPPGPRRQGFDDFWAINQSSHTYLDAHYYADEPDPIQMEGYTHATEADLAMELMNTASHDPFCCYLSWGPPHMPYAEVPQEYKDMYDPAALALRTNVAAYNGEMGGHQYSQPANPDANQEAVMRETLRDYYAHVTAIDEQFGRLLDFLETNGLAEDTIVVFTADHGDELWSHGALGKGDPYVESANVPFLIRWPDEIPAGRVTDELLSTVDFTPTLLGLAGLDPAPEMEGRDRSDAVRGKAMEGPDSVYLLRTADPRPSVFEWRGVKTDRYTYAELLDGTPWLLYDDQADPYQRTNLAYDSGHETVRETLTEKLLQWQDRLDDPMVPGRELIERIAHPDVLEPAFAYYGIE